MHLAFDPTGSIQGLETLLSNALEVPGVQALLVLAGDGNQFQPEAIDPLLQKVGVPVFGGCFPQVIYEEQHFEKGTIVMGLGSAVNLAVIEDISQPTADFDAALESIHLDQESDSTLFVFVDGFSSKISALIEALFDHFGLESNYIGGGAGSLSMVQQPCLLTNQGMLVDAAVIAQLDCPSGVGVSHGWEVVDGPFRVTNSDNNTIKELEYRKASDVYREAIESRLGNTSGDDFFEHAGSFPFGIGKLGTEMVVRDPVVMSDEGWLTCVGEVPQESVVYVLNGQPKQLLLAAEAALAKATTAYAVHTKAPNVTIFFDCVSRVLFLGDDFNQEVRAVHQPAVPLIGAATIGEIANSGKDYLEFYNKTCVVGAMRIR